MTVRIKALAVAAAALFAAPAAAHASEGGLTPAGCISTSVAPCATGESVTSVNQVALSPDGRQLYAVSPADSSLTIFDRDPATAKLNQRSQCFRYDALHGCEDGFLLDGASAVTVSPDGKNVYVASIGVDGWLAIFDRAADGSLIEKHPPNCFGMGGCHFPNGGLVGTQALAVSPDGASLYVATFAGLLIFNRHADGMLEQLPADAGCITSVAVAGCVLEPNLRGLTDIAISPDSKTVYVGAQQSDKIMTYARAANGSLTRAGCISQTPDAGCILSDQLVGNSYGLAVSPDGKNVYSASRSTGGEPSGIAVLKRDAATGVLTQGGCVADSGSCTHGVALGVTTDLAVSPDGSSVYAATGNGIAVFERNSAGDLAQKGCIKDTGAPTAGCGTADGLGWSPWAIAIAPDGHGVYTASDDSISAFGRDLPQPPATTPVTTQPTTPSTVVTRGTTATKLVAKLRSHSLKVKRGKKLSIAYSSNVRGTATLQVLKGRKRVLTMKSSNGKAFRIAKKLARGKYTIKLTLRAGGQTAGDSAKLTVR
jgi:DNA-binding beta-propeller fold protein YncE